MDKRLTIVKKHLLFGIFVISSLIIFYSTLKDLLILSFADELYSHFIFIPLISVYLIYSDRKTIFNENNFSFQGSIVVMISLLLFTVGINREGLLNQNDYLSLMTVSAVICCIGGFIQFYGLQAFRKASFPLFFLILMAPIPHVILDKVILILQIFSAEVSYMYFKLIGTPVYREGFVFNLLGLSIEVAEQCGGIRSSIVLFIISLLAGRVFLKTWWKKLLLIMFVFPITIMKNGIRIVTLSLLAVYVDKAVSFR